MSGLSSSEENLLMSNGFSINDMKHSVDNHGMFEGKDGTAVYINRDLATFFILSCIKIKLYLFYYR